MLQNGKAELLFLRDGLGRRFSKCGLLSICVRIIVKNMPQMYINVWGCMLKCEVLRPRF